MKRMHLTERSTGNGNRRNRRWLAAAAVAVLAMGILSGCGEEADVGRDAALEAALADAGVSEDETTRLQVTEDRDDGQKVYDIRFDVGNIEYDYEVRATDGSIVSSDTETVDGATQGNDASQNTGTTGGTTGDSGTTGGTSQTTGGTTGGATTAISQDQAISIALERVPGATANDIRIELDNDDGQYRYEGEIIYDQKEYDFEIDANTGTILEWSEERR